MTNNVTAFEELKVRYFENEDYCIFAGYEDDKSEPPIIAYVNGEEEGLVITCGKSVDEDGLYTLSAGYDEELYIADFDSYKKSMDAFNKLVEAYNKAQTADIDKAKELFVEHGLEQW